MREIVTGCDLDSSGSEHGSVVAVVNVVMTIMFPKCGEFLDQFNNYSVNLSGRNILS
jgi:hypothetical protein